MQEKIDALLKKLVTIPAMTPDQYITQIDSLILKAEYNFEIYNELLLIADDYCADCQFAYDKYFSMRFIDNKAGGEPSTVLDKLTKAMCINSDQMEKLQHAEKLQREFKMRRENSNERLCAYKKIKNGFGGEKS